MYPKRVNVSKENKADKMADEVLPTSLERLEINHLSSPNQRSTSSKESKSTNPFWTRNESVTAVPDCKHRFWRKTTVNDSQSAVLHPRGVKCTTNFKRSKEEKTQDKTKKRCLIKEAVLKLKTTESSAEVDSSSIVERGCKSKVDSSKKKSLGHNSVTKDFEELNIGRDERRVKDDASIRDVDNSDSSGRTRSNTMPSLKRGKTSATNDNNHNASTNTCSIQARISPPPCDVTIDELASYFEEFVHIPKKMSRMAEMMYI